MAQKYTRHTIWNIKYLIIIKKYVLIYKKNINEPQKLWILIAWLIKWLWKKIQLIYGYYVHLYIKGKNTKLNTILVISVLNE